MNRRDIDTSVGELTDRREITDLVSRLGGCLDDRRFDDMRSLLDEDATVHTPGGTAEGRDALIDQARRNHPPEERTQHVITNVLVDRDGDRAEVRANLVVHFAPAAEARRPAPAAAPAPPVRVTLGEVYRFDVVRTPGGWRFSRVETTPLWLSGSFGDDR